MDSRRRVMAALRGQAVDRVPLALWRHFGQVDRDPPALARAVAGFCRKYRVDLVKTMPNGCYPVEDWCQEVDFSGQYARVVKGPIAGARDWLSIGVNSPDQGALGREVEAIKALRQEVGPLVPIVATVFSPLTQAAKLAGSALADHLEAHGPWVHQALGAITLTTASFARRALEAGADGLFFATQMASRKHMSLGQYREFGRPYDLQVLAQARGSINILHLCGPEVMFHLLRDYPVGAINWHIWEVPPSPREALASSPRAILGGLRYQSFSAQSQPGLRDQVRSILGHTGGRRLILGPGCVVPEDSDPEKLFLVSHLLSRYSREDPGPEEYE